MTHETKIVMALGIASILSTSFVPLASTFADTTVSGTPVNEVVTYEVPSNLSVTLDIASGGVDPSAATTIDPGESLATKGNAVKISGNSNYKVTLKDADTNNAMTNGKGGTLPAYTTAQTGLTNTGWGVILGTAYGTNHSGGLSTTNYIGVPISTGTAITVVQTTGTTAQFSDDTTTVKYGIKTDVSQASGTYTDTITFTVAAV